jgi:hypothetical protein
MLNNTKLILIMLQYDPYYLYLIIVQVNNGRYSHALLTNTSAAGNLLLTL